MDTKSTKNIEDANDHYFAGCCTGALMVFLTLASVLTLSILITPSGELISLNIDFNFKVNNISRALAAFVLLFQIIVIFKCLSNKETI